MYENYIKVIFDYLFGLVAIFFFLPIILLITIIQLLYLSGSPFFIQERPGKDEKIFRLVKFRTMNDKRDSNGVLLPESQRIPPIGKFLRSYSLDELPQILNVLKGDISFVGPRPLRVEYLPHYSRVQAQRHSIKPGITGWAQVNGRNAISWEKKFELDIWYVENMSFKVDVKILYLTMYKVFKREGIGQNTSLTMEPFKGVELNG